MDRKIAWVSEPRFAPYLQEAEDDVTVAWKLYEWNAHVSAALTECLHHAEVLLRNAMMEQLRHKGPFEDPWTRPNDSVVATVERRRGATSVTADDVVSGLTLGYWTQFFTRGTLNEELWRSCLRHAFPGSPGTRQAVDHVLQDMRDLRNRAAHQDSLLERDPGIELKKIMTLVEWIDPDARHWLESIERVTPLVRERPVPSKLDTVVVAVDSASLDLYRHHAAYVCPQERSFRPVDYMAFYHGQKVLAFIPQVCAIEVPTRWNKEEAKRLLASDYPDDKKLGGIMSYCLKHGWEANVPVQVWLLSPENADETVRRRNDLIHERRGRGSAFVRHRRYLSRVALLGARTTADLRSNPGEGKGILGESTA